MKGHFHPVELGFLSKTPVISVTGVIRKILFIIWKFEEVRKCNLKKITD